MFGRYLGMTNRWDKWGHYKCLSVIRLEDNDVLDVRCESKEGFNSIEVGAGQRPLYQVRNEQLMEKYEK